MWNQLLNSLPLCLIVLFTSFNLSVSITFEQDVELTPEQKNALDKVLKIRIINKLKKL